MLLPNMTDEEKCREAFMSIPDVTGLIDEKLPIITDKYMRATHFPYFQRFAITDKRHNEWYILCLMPTKGLRRRRKFVSLAYTIYDFPRGHKEENKNAGKGVFMYNPEGMRIALETIHNEDPYFSAFMDVIPHAIHRFTERYLVPNGLTEISIHKKVEFLLKDWRHFDVAPDLHGDKSSVKHKEDGICPYDVIMKNGGILRGQFVDNLLIRFFTYISKDDLFDNQAERHAEMMAERAAMRANGQIPF